LPTRHAVGLLTGIRVSGPGAWVPFSAFFCGMTKEYGGGRGRDPATLIWFLIWISQDGLVRTVFPISLKPAARAPPSAILLIGVKRMQKRLHWRGAT